MPLSKRRVIPRSFCFKEGASLAMPAGFPHQRRVVSQSRLLLQSVGIAALLIASGCQVSTHTGMYRGFVNWRRFREPILVLERAPLSDEEPSLWGPRLKTHALRWHDQKYGDPRYEYPPRENVAQASGNRPGETRVAQSPKSEPNQAPSSIPPSGANRPVQLPLTVPESMPAPPAPPPGEIVPEQIDDDPLPGYIEDQEEESPIPPRTSEEPVADSLPGLILPAPAT